MTTMTAAGGVNLDGQPLVSIIIVNFNRVDLVKACLESVWRQSFTNTEVIVVDNGSTDGSVEFLESIDAENFRLVKLDRNTGFAGGCNAGIAASRGRYIATLNNDAEAEPGWVEALVTAMEEAPRIGMCASKMFLRGERGRIDKAGHLMYFDGLNHGRGSGEPDRGQFDEAQEVLFPDGAAALYRREMLEEVGLFDEKFFAYGDDADLGLRGQLAGWKCQYVPGAIVHHVHSATAGKFSAFKAFLIERNRLFVAVKTFPLLLLLVSPAFTALRFAFHLYGAIFLVGSSGRFASGTSRCELGIAMLRAYGSALKHFPGMWVSRAEVRRSSRITDAAFLSLLWKHRITLRALTLGS